MTVLITADLHFDSNPKNADRWNLFPWLRKQAKTYSVDWTLLLGDITDQKDRHSAPLVNRLIDEIQQLSELTKVVILRGNHDCIDENTPFFEFVKHIGDRVCFITEPTEFAVDVGVRGDTKKDRGTAVFLPSTRRWKEEWVSLEHLSGLIGGEISTPNTYIFTHQTYDGCKAENGQVLSGIPPSFFKDFKGQVISGDIHVPQRIGKNITYVGSPYRVHFGDTFMPRVILLKSGKMADLHYPSQGRELIEVRNLEALEKTAFEMGTQVKIRVRLKRTEYPEWPAIKKQVRALAERRGWELCGLELQRLDVKDKQLAEDVEPAAAPDEALRWYAFQKKMPKLLLERGLELLKEAQ